MTDAELRELIPLAALDALDADERAAFDEAIADRPELLAELDDLRAVTAELPADVSVRPPARLKAAVLAEITGTDEAVAPPQPPSNVVPLRRRWVLAAAAAAVLVVVGVGAWVLVGSDPSEQEQAEEVIEQPDAEILPLEGALEGVRIVYSPSSEDAALVVDEMPDPGDQNDYQLWAIRDGVPASAGVFRPADDGSVLVLVEDFDPSATMAITEEPAGGSDLPTGEILVAST
jgi:hypothetical protein